LRAGGRAGSKRRHESARGGHPSDFSDKDTMLFNILLGGVAATLIFSRAFLIDPGLAR